MVKKSRDKKDHSNRFFHLWNTKEFYLNAIVDLNFVFRIIHMGRRFKFIF